MSEGFSNELRAGAARVDISPGLGTQVAGGIGLYRPTQLIIDPIYAKALVLQAGSRKLCFLSLDLPVASTEVATAARHRAGEQFGYDPAAIMIHCTQNHAAPMWGHVAVSARSPYIAPGLSWLRGGDDAYSELVEEKVLEVIGLAEDNLEPVTVSVGSGLEGRIAHNRRVVFRDGHADAIQIKVGDPDILYKEGPIDPELGVVCMVGKDARAKAFLLHHTSHPCHLNGKNCVTSGWPGAWADEVRKAYGPNCTPLVVNGCCGNIHHRDRFNPDFNHSDDYDRIGRLLAETTRDVVQNRLKILEDPILDYRVRQLPLPLRDLDAGEIEEARALLREHPDPMWQNEEKTAVDWAWCYAVAILDLAELREQTPKVDHEIQVFRIGDTAVVGLCGEPFVEGQLEIKLKSPAYRTFIAHMSNGYVGYIPTQHAFARGGYETRTGHPSKFAPEALDRIVEATVELLNEVFGE